MRVCEASSVTVSENVSVLVRKSTDSVSVVVTDANVCETSEVLVTGSDDVSVDEDDSVSDKVCSMVLESAADSVWVGGGVSVCVNVCVRSLVPRDGEIVTVVDSVIAELFVCVMEESSALCVSEIETVSDCVESADALAECSTENDSDEEFFTEREADAEVVEVREKDGPLFDPEADAS